MLIVPLVQYQKTLDKLSQANASPYHRDLTNGHSSAQTLLNKSLNLLLLLGLCICFAFFMKTNMSGIILRLNDEADETDNLGIVEIRFVHNDVNTTHYIHLIIYA